MIPIVWVSRYPEIKARGTWDQVMLIDLFDGKLWKHGFEFEDRYSFDGLTGAVVVVPAQHHVNDIDWLNEQMSGLEWVLVILTGDEEALVPNWDLAHDNMILWVQSPHPNLNDTADRYIPFGYGPNVRQRLDTVPDKDTDWFFSGQVTHKRREQCVKALRTMGGGMLRETAGFLEGFSPAVYMDWLKASKVAPAPSGPASVDSFRVCEALEAGCIPLADGRTSTKDQRRMWDLTMPGHPFPIIDDWASAPAITKELLADWPANAARVQAWWIQMKRTYALWLKEDLEELIG